MVQNLELASLMVRTKFEFDKKGFRVPKTGLNQLSKDVKKAFDKAVKDSLNTNYKKNVNDFYKRNFSNRRYINPERFNNLFSGMFLNPQELKKQNTLSKKLFDNNFSIVRNYNKKVRKEIKKTRKEEDKSLSLNTRTVLTGFAQSVTNLKGGGFNSNIGQRVRGAFGIVQSGKDVASVFTKFAKPIGAAIGGSILATLSLGAVGLGAVIGGGIFSYLLYSNAKRAKEFKKQLGEDTLETSDLLKRESNLLFNISKSNKSDISTISGLANILSYSGGTVNTVSGFIGASGDLFSKKTKSNQSLATRQAYQKVLDYYKGDTLSAGLALIDRSLQKGDTKTFGILTRELFGETNASIFGGELKEAFNRKGDLSLGEYLKTQSTYNKVNVKTYRNLNRKQQDLFLSRKKIIAESPELVQAEDKSLEEIKKNLKVTTLAGISQTIISFSEALDNYLTDLTALLKNKNFLTSLAEANALIRKLRIETAKIGIDDIFYRNTTSDSNVVSKSKIRGGRVGFENSNIAQLIQKNVESKVENKNFNLDSTRNFLDQNYDNLSVKNIGD